jgi:hypothetical protein
MRGAEVDVLRLARGRTITRAIIRRAQIRAALNDAARRLTGAQCQILQFGSARIGRVLPRMTRSIPIAGPPDIADHVVEAVAVRLEAADRRGRAVAVLVRVVDGEDTLPDVGDRARSPDRRRLTAFAFLLAPWAGGPLKRLSILASFCQNRSSY